MFLIIIKLGDFSGEFPISVTLKACSGKCALNKLSCVAFCFVAIRRRCDSARAMRATMELDLKR